jgi:hypothetical protein
LGIKKETLSIGLLDKSLIHPREIFSSALEKSQKTKQIISFFSSEFRMQLYISNSWCTVDHFGRKPD